MLALGVGSVTVQLEPDLLLISQVSPAATVKFAVLVTGAPPAPAMTVDAGTFSQIVPLYWIGNSVTALWLRLKKTRN